MAAASQAEQRVRSTDPELKKHERAAINAKQVQERKEYGKMDPWECFVKRKIKIKYPWQSFEEQERIIPSPTHL